MNIDLATIAGLVIALTQWIKERLGLQGRAAEVASFVIGFVAGGAYQVVKFPPQVAGDWLGSVITAIIMALVPSGLYKLVTQFADKLSVSNQKLIKPDQSFKPSDTGGLKSDSASKS